MKYAITVLFLIVLLVASAQAQPGPWIRVSLIEASQSDTLFIDKNLKSIEKQLSNLRSDDEKMQEILKKFKRFTSLWTAKPQQITYGGEARIFLDKTKTMVLDITLHALQKDFYPASVRWFVQEEKKEKDILKISKFKFNKNRCLLLLDSGKKERDITSFKLLAIELVKPPVEK